MATPAIDITGARDTFVEGMSSYDRWAESYQPRVSPELFTEAARAVAAGNVMEAAFILNQGGTLREAMGVGDLPILLAATVRTRLLKGYGTPTQNWRSLVNTDRLPDLEQWTAAQTLFSSDDQRGNTTPNNLIPEVPEFHGYDEARLSEAAEIAQLRTYGLVWSFSRRMMLADNLRALSNMTRDVGLAFRRTQNDRFRNLLALTSSTSVSGQLLRDGYNLFETSSAAGHHANMVTGAIPLSATNVKAQMLLFGAQTDRNGVKNNQNGIGVTYLVVPSALELTALEICDPAPRITGASDTLTSTNILRRLTPVVVPELDSDKDWYLAAGPSMAPGLVYGTLNGRDEPEYFTQLENANLADADGSKQKARLDFGFWAEQWHTWRKVDDTT